MQTFYSQQGEDLFVFLNFINVAREDGTYLEIGGLDGLTYSNTKFFQDELKYSGVLVEPLPEAYKSLVKNRPLDLTYNLAISSSEEPVTFVGNWASAGMCGTMSDSFKVAHHPNAEPYIVDNLPLSNVLCESGLTYVDFFSLDVEGGELEVLSTMDWSVPVYIMCIELDGHNEDKDEKCREILRENGFVLEHRMCINEFWRNPNYARKDLLFLPNPQLTDMQHPCMEPHCVPDIKKGIETYAQAKREH
mgnify:CR=1 FL=1|tara:strand:+ start:27197 stop:27940 length:744 start_codon:yes stop_codon:yes gene_type:complete